MHTWFLPPFWSRYCHWLVCKALNGWTMIHHILDILELSELLAGKPALQPACTIPGAWKCRLKWKNWKSCRYLTNAISIPALWFTIKGFTGRGWKPDVSSKKTDNQNISVTNYSLGWLVESLFLSLLKSIAAQNPPGKPAQWSRPSQALMRSHVPPMKTQMHHW